MTPEEFRTAGHALVDWIADHRANLESLPVRPPVKPGDVRQAFPIAAPTVSDREDGDRGDISEIIADLNNIVVPGMTHVQHPMYFGWFPANASLASVLGDMASSGLGGLGISWESCPALTEVEEVVCDWMRQLTGMADHWHGTITDTASTAALTALLLAREHASDLSQNRSGLIGQDKALVVYTTTQAHSSIAKAALLAGFGYDSIRNVAIDPYTHSMDAAALAAAIDSDIAAGRIPAVVVASIGTTGVTAIDPVSEIAQITSAHGIWLHVDAAMAGSAMLLKECRPAFAGTDAADSFSWNPHKWIGTILDCSLLYLRDPEFCQRVLSTNPTYLAGADEATQYRDWGIPLGRRFRALKLWFHLRIDGVESIQERLRADLEDAKWLAAEVEATAGWEVVAPVNFQTVVVRHSPSHLVPAQAIRPGTAQPDSAQPDSAQPDSAQPDSAQPDSAQPDSAQPDMSPTEVTEPPEAYSRSLIDAHTRGWMDSINQSGQAFLSPTRLDDGRWVARVSIGAETADRTHVARMWQLMQEAVQ